MYAGVPNTAPSRVRRVWSLRPRRVELREAEIEDLGEERALLVLRQEDVLGLQIAVDDARAVRLREPAAHLRDHRHGGRRRAADCRVMRS
jgi:hypothetical protein